jgi:hypothetical protein
MKNNISDLKKIEFDIDTFSNETTDYIYNEYY